MNEQEKARLRQKIQFRMSPLLDVALSLIVLYNPERFGPRPAWAERVRERLEPSVLDYLQEQIERIDVFALAIELETTDLPIPEAIHTLSAEQPELEQALMAYWHAVAPEIAAHSGRLAESLSREAEQLRRTDPLTFLCRFSDRLSVAGDGESIILHWGKGMRVPLADLHQIVIVPSTFCPRRFMFYRHGPLQIFFYSPDKKRAAATDELEAPESLTLGFAALADPTRLKILRLIARENLPAQEMARRLQLNESTISRHLRMLVEAGLAARERQEGRYIIYSYNGKRLSELLRMAETFLQGSLGPESDTEWSLEHELLNAVLGI